MSYDREPFDDYDVDVQDYWYHRNRQIDREYKIKQLARELERTRSLSSEALLAREDVSFDPSENQSNEEDYGRLSFEDDDQPLRSGSG